MLQTCFIAYNIENWFGYCKKPVIQLAWR